MTTNCQGCGQPNLKLVLDLGYQPICGRFLESEKDFVTEKFYPLKLVRCESCTLVQLEEVPPNREVFGSRFALFSGGNRETSDYMESLAGQLIERLGLKMGDYVVDIGSNDGTFLVSFKKRGMQVLGIDPARDVAQTAIDRGIQTIIKPFEDSLEEVSGITRGKLKLVTALRMLGLTDRVHECLEGIRQILGDGVFVSQHQYLPELVRNRYYDIIYHEHARYYSAASLSNLLARHGLHVYDAKREDYNSGTFLAFASLTDLPKTPELQSLLDAEKLHPDAEDFEDFAMQSITCADKLINIVNGDAVSYPKVIPKGSRIAGIGAPMKSSTMLNFCRLGPDKIEYLTDTSPLKIGTFSPGMHIPVVSEEHFFQHPPDTAIIFAWQAKDRIMADYRKRGYRGKFVIPTHLPTVVD